MATRIERAREFRCSIDNAAGMLTDEQAVTVQELYREWAAGETYAVGDRRNYNGALYSCLLYHTSEATWTPDTSPSLWAKVLIPDSNVTPDWEQPDSTNPYKVGDKVMHNGIVWISVVDNNVWEPGVYGWEPYVEDDGKSSSGLLEDNE